ncbi:actin, partial [Acrasis kona]
MSQPPVIVDVGAGLIKAGFSGEDEPRCIIPTLVGRHKERAVLSGIIGGRDTYVGEQAQSRRGLLAMRSPIEHGVVTNWDDMELLMKHTFNNELQIFPEDHAALITEPPFNSDVSKQKWYEILFESFGFDKVKLVLGQLMSLYASGRTTGIVLDVGDSGANAVPVA